MQRLPFRELWAVDFEFIAGDGEQPSPVCMVYKNLHTGEVCRLWQDELRQRRHAPLSTGSDSLFIAYYASAELGCFLALGWPMPERILDLCAEFRCITTGLPVPCGRGLLGAMAYFGLDSISVGEKKEMIELILRGGPYTPDQRAEILNYCGSDVAALAVLLPQMLPYIDLPRALLRGRYMAAAARMEWTGVPIDTETLSVLRTRWDAIRGGLVADIDAGYGVFDGLTFKADRWAAFLQAHDIPWPTLDSGALDLSDEAFRDMSRIHPVVSPIRELRDSLSQMRLNSLAAGHDGRNRCLLSAFASKTGRNQPSNSKFIFGPSTWLRGLVKPGRDRAVAYIDYEQQEFGIAAALSGDAAMMEAYQSGDPYLTFAKQAGAVPASATKQTHKAIRDQFKACALGVQYGMREESLANRMGEHVIRARELLRLHRQTYSRYWQWSDEIEYHAMLIGQLQTVFGWKVQVSNQPGQDANPRSLRNFPLQGNGAEMLRLACCMVTEAGIQVCAPVHDALLIEADINVIEQVVQKTQAIMMEASRLVLGGFTIRTDATIVRYPDRYMDDRGKAMWLKVQARLHGYVTGDTPPPSSATTPSNLVSSMSLE